MRVELRGLGKDFFTRQGKVMALQSVSLEIAEGELFVLLGPSGCGKSTLLNLIAGLEHPSRGEILFDAEPVTAVPARRRNVAMVFQSYALYPHLSVFGNIAFPLRIAGEKKPAIDARVRQTAALLGLEDLLPARPRELSGGQRQRVAIARALVRQPRLFLLDEPLSNLDARLRTATRVELKRLQRELGVTTVYVTHDQTEAMTLGDRVAVLRRGRLEQVAPPGALYERPANPFVAGFLGAPPMNLLPALCRRTSRGMEIEWEGARFRLPATGGVDLPAGPCLLGIRPEHLRPEGQAEGTGFSARVEAVEDLGREVLLHLCRGHSRLAMLAGKGDFRPGEALSVVPDLERVHLYPQLDDTT